MTDLSTFVRPRGVHVDVIIHCHALGPRVVYDQLVYAREDALLSARQLVVVSPCHRHDIRCTQHILGFRLSQYHFVKS